MLRMFSRRLSKTREVSHTFGAPGEENLDLCDSLSHSSIRFILTWDEQATGFMAATHGRLCAAIAPHLIELKTILARPPKLPDAELDPWPDVAQVRR